MKKTLAIALMLAATPALADEANPWWVWDYTSTKCLPGVAPKIYEEMLGDVDGLPDTRTVQDNGETTVFLRYRYDPAGHTKMLVVSTSYTWCMAFRSGVLSRR